MKDNLDALRHIEGFPIGEDEDLHALSDPPHYTAYPNPHIAEFIAQWGTPYDETTDDYHREPYVSDVSEGKNDPIYNAHSYHTKVPYKAIIPFIEHYTEPGDIVFDGFCGTGMTGVAAQSVGRRAILCDLSPAATFIAYNYNTPVDVAAFEREAQRILKEVEAECGWMYETAHTAGGAARPTGTEVKGRINYTVWSDVFVCPYCHGEIVFWDANVDTEKWEIRQNFVCPECGSQVTKRELARVREQVWDSTLGMNIERARQVPVFIDYSIGRHRYTKRPDISDLALIRKIEQDAIPFWYPSNKIPLGYNTEQPRRSHGVTHVHHFFTHRNLWAIAALWQRFSQKSSREYRFLLFSLTSFLVKTGSRLHNIGFKGGGLNLAGQVPNTLYIPSTVAERNIFDLSWRKTTDLAKAFAVNVSTQERRRCISTQSATSLSNIPSDSVDYIFVDPPFGENIMYSEVSYIWESWLRAFTRNDAEAIINRIQGKALQDYSRLMLYAFREMYRIIKPGRWITVEFHNSKASVWNAIQEALARAGFLVAQVTVLDKQQGTFKQMTSAGAVKNDLVINAYKPRAGFTERLLSQAGQGLEPDFVRQHLAQLPIAANIERTQEMLYSKYLAYYVQRGYQIAYNGEQFYRALPQWGLVELDGYWFADEAQANEYEKRKAAQVAPKGKTANQQSVLFISDEKSARLWLWNFLETPQTYDAIYTAFVKALQTPEDEIPELKAMLEEGFVRTNGTWKRPDALTREELEQKRRERLQRQFAEYLELARTGQRLKEVRKEALVEGFTEAYRAGRFADILTVGRKLPARLVEAAPELRDFIEIAEAKVEG